MTVYAFRIWALIYVHTLCVILPPLPNQHCYVPSDMQYMHSKRFNILTTLIHTSGMVLQFLFSEKKKIQYIFRKNIYDIHLQSVIIGTVSMLYDLLQWCSCVVHPSPPCASEHHSIEKYTTSFELPVDLPVATCRP